MKSDTLYFDAIPDSVFIGHHGHYNDVNDLVKITPSAIYYGERINIHFEPSASNQIKILVEKKSQGANREQAGIYARNIQYNFKTDTDMIIMDPFFSTPRNDLYRTQEVEVKIYVPIGKYVKFGENAHLVTWHSHEDGALKMTADGLENEDNVEIEMESDLLNDPQVRVTDDSVIIKTDEIEIKTRRD